MRRRQRAARAPVIQARYARREKGGRQENKKGEQGTGATGAKGGRRHRGRGSGRQESSKRQEWQRVCQTEREKGMAEAE